MPERLPRVAVIGSGVHPWTELSEPLGSWLAEKGCHLINGGGSGVMLATARAFAGHPARRGLVVGLLPSTADCETLEQRAQYGNPPGYPNPYVDIPIYTHLPLSGAAGMDCRSRNHIIVLTAECVVALPGSEGTRSEIQLALDYGKPLIIVSPQGEWEEFHGRSAILVASIQDAIQELDKRLFNR